MKTLTYMGPNDRNQSGVSWKFWKIQRRGRKVTVSWGAAEVVRRRVIPAWETSREWQHATPAQAKADEICRTEKKLKSGYQELPEGRMR